MKRSLVLLAILFPLAAYSQTQLAPTLKEFVKYDQPRVALMDVRVIDGTGLPAREHQEVFIEGGKIAYVGEPRTEDAKNTNILSLTGESVMPGLVGMHDHMFYPAGGVVFHEMPFSFPRLYLAAGVTSLRTTGSLEPYTDIELKHKIDTGEMIGPKLHITGPYLDGDKTFILQTHHVHGPEDMRATVDYWAGQGATSFKLYNDLSHEEMKAAIDAAHAHHLKITGHLCSIGFKEAAALGIDDLEHGLLVDTELYPEKKPDLCPDTSKVEADLAKREVSSPEIQGIIHDLLQHKVALTSTLSVFEDFVPGRPSLQPRVLEAMSAQSKSDYLQRRVGISDLKRGPSDWPKLLRMEMDFERDFVKQGGLLLAGVDPTGAGGALPGYGDQREVELLVEAGFTPLEAIKIATSNGAQFLGESDRIGTIAVGKQADLIVVKGDPSKDINDIEKVETVFKDGVGFDPQKLAESVRGLVGIR